MQKFQLITVNIINIKLEIVWCHFSMSDLEAKRLYVQKIYRALSIKSIYL